MSRTNHPDPGARMRIGLCAAIAFAIPNGVAHAVNLAPNGVGQVLLYPYYTVNGGNSALVSIVNTTDQSKAVRVRFLEALNGANVFDFNLYLAPFDVWITSVNHTAEGAALFTNDCSCTVPNAVGKDWVVATPGPASTFKPFDFASNVPDIVGLTELVRVGDALVPLTPAERLRQGHVEIIEMGNLLNEPAPSLFRPRAWTIHAGPMSNRVPNNCPALQAAWTAGGNSATSGQWLADRSRAVLAANDGATGQALVGGGGLLGSATIVDVELGRSLSFNADAIDGFFRADGLSGPEATLHAAPGETTPNLSQARTSNGSKVAAHVQSGGANVTMRFDVASGGGLKAVSAALMARFLYNEYNRQDGLSATSEWVVTFPTKRLHTYDRWLLDTRPFSDNQDVEPSTLQALHDEQPFDSIGLCEAYTLSRWDREDYQGVAGQLPPIVTRPPGAAVVPPRLCWNANVIAIGQALEGADGAAVLGASQAQGAVRLVIDQAADRYASGWARIEFNHPAQAAGTFGNFLITEDGIATIGLPAIGFWSSDFLNSNLVADVRANFGIAHRHRWISDGYVGATDPGFSTLNEGPLPLNVAGLAGWTTTIDPHAPASSK